MNIGFTQSNHPSSSDFSVFFRTNNNWDIGGQAPTLTYIKTLNAGWCQANLSIESSMYFSTSCDTRLSHNFKYSFDEKKEKKIIKSFDVMGRENIYKSNSLHFFYL